MSADLPLIIVNPKSGRGTSERKWASMAGVIRENLGPFECEFTRGPEDAARLAESAARAGRRFIVSVGGDGTVSEIASGILRSGSGAELGTLPGGTGSDYRRTLKLPVDLGAAARQLRTGTTRTVDVGRLTYVDHERKETSRYFVNTASFGMSGAVATRANLSSKALGGTLTYAAATVRTIFSYNYPDVVLEYDEQPGTRLRVITVCVAIGPSFGGGMQIAPDADPNDGLFDVVIIGDMKTTSVLLNSYKLYNGGVNSMKKVATLRARKVKASPATPGTEILLEVDGETPGRLPATMEIIPSALRVRV